MHWLLVICIVLGIVWTGKEFWRITNRGSTEPLRSSSLPEFLDEPPLMQTPAEEVVLRFPVEFLLSIVQPEAWSQALRADRTDLYESIAYQGIHEPGLVYVTRKGMFLKDGHNRLCQAQKLGVKYFWCRVVII